MPEASAFDGAIARKDAVIGPTDRSFGLTFAAVFTVIAALPLLHGRAPRWWVLIPAVVMVALALTRPAILAPFNRWWARFGQILHKIVNPLILGLMFFLIITPIGLLMRVLGKRSMRTGPEPGAASYWVLREPPGPDPKSMRRQF